MGTVNALMMSMAIYALIGFGAAALQLSIALASISAIIH